MKSLAMIWRKILEVQKNNTDFPVGYLGALKEAYDNKLSEAEVKEKIDHAKIMISVSPDNLIKMFKGNLEAYEWIVKREVERESISWR